MARVRVRSRSRTKSSKKTLAAPAAGSPVLVIDFTSGSTVDSRITMTRASTSTRVGPTGLVETVATHLPRLEYNPITLAQIGLLVEMQRTNIATYSEEFDHWTWLKTASSATANATTSPAGTTTADKIAENTTTGVHGVTRNVTAGPSTAYSASVFVKAAGRTRGRIELFGYNGSGTADFDLTAETATAGVTGTWTGHSAAIQKFPNGWYRVSLTVTTGVGITAIDMKILLANAAGATSYTGDNTSGLFLWGAQLEAGPKANSYIPAGAAEVTRAADIGVMTGTNFSSWFNAAEGTFVVDFIKPLNVLTGKSPCVVAARQSGAGNDAANTIEIQAQPATANRGLVAVGGVSQAALSFTAGGLASVKAALAYKANDFALSANGAAAVTDTSGTLPTVNSLNIGYNTTTDVLCSHIRKISYYNTRVSNAQLQTLTS